MWVEELVPKNNFNKNVGILVINIIKESLVSILVLCLITILPKNKWGKIVKYLGLLN